MTEEEKQEYEQILIEHLEDSPLLKAKAADLAQNRHGEYTAGLVGHYKNLALFKYLLHGDVAAFRRDLSESVHLMLTLLERFDADDPRSYVNMGRYINVLDALAACDFDGARALCEHLRPLHAESERDRGYGHPLAMGFGYALRAFVLDEDPQEQMRAAGWFFDICQQRKDCRNFAGYAELFGVFLGTDEDSMAADSAVMEIVRGHQRESRGNGMFADDIERFLCVSGIGMVNLARQRGLNVEPYPPLIPADLLC